MFTYIIRFISTQIVAGIRAVNRVYNVTFVVNHAIMPVVRSYIKGGFITLHVLVARDYIHSELNMSDEEILMINLSANNSGTNNVLAPAF